MTGVGAFIIVLLLGGNIMFMIYLNQRLDKLEVLLRRPPAEDTESAGSRSTDALLRRASARIEEISRQAARYDTDRQEGRP